jgi:thiamine biosynthesis lipoprotein ApbE
VEPGDLVLDADSHTIALPVGCALDLGGIAKGMAVDASSIFSAGKACKQLRQRRGDPRARASSR